MSRGAPGPQKVAEEGLEEGPPGFPRLCISACGPSLLGLRCRGHWGRKPRALRVPGGPGPPGQAGPAPLGDMFPGAAAS